MGAKVAIAKISFCIVKVQIAITLKIFIRISLQFSWEWFPTIEMNCEIRMKIRTVIHKSPKNAQNVLSNSSGLNLKKKKKYWIDFDETSTKQLILCKKLSVKISDNTNKVIAKWGFWTIAQSF